MNSQRGATPVLFTFLFFTLAIFGYLLDVAFLEFKKYELKTIADVAVMNGTLARLADFTSSQVATVTQ